jgi:mono/diheme cytochrome c family protein
MKNYLPLLISWLLSFFGVLLAADTPIDFIRDVRPIFETHCYDCHGESKQKSGLRLDIKQSAFKGGDGYGESIVPYKTSESPLIRLVTSADKNERMPPSGKGLSEMEIDILTKWIESGALWPEGADTAMLSDKRDHWSFKPLPQMHDGPSLDPFVEAKLAELGLSMGTPADRNTWLRRVTYDLTGLPPTPREVEEFENDQSRDSFERVVDRLLQSPRYGERWAQHWLDVVRYADTHGFEVNTERPNAWPYRDYVIRAFNNDIPYDRFVQEQIVGDAMGVDAATGFLVTASVLLPGQIGKDAPSIRLARQDAIDEIVNNISQTFLGLSVGCARCHDHKFDPITAKDYYAMQAFVAGVEYEDREMQNPERETQKKQTEALRLQLKDIQVQFGQYVPFAQPGIVRKETNAKENSESFASIEAKFVRFTIHDSNLHPSLGLIEPCIDEFEIFTDEPQLRNIAIASQGTKVTASSSRSSEMHQLEHINDGLYGNAKSWMAETKSQGWVMFEFSQATKINRVVWSRDRTGMYSDRLATAFTLEAGISPDKLLKLSESKPLRPTVGAGPLNTDRFNPVRTQRVRFTILATNSLEPCIDELEVFNLQGINIALASQGTKATTSGDTIVADRHDPRFLNDGHYGNERSWMANEQGKGWVELEFPGEQEITRVLWSRDREGKFLDRLPIEYRIEVQTGEGWSLVADSTDRRPHIAGMLRGPEFTLSGLAPEEQVEANRLLTEKVVLEKKIKSSESGQFVFAGKFRSPDEIRLLQRGDPEQPKEEVGPAVLSALGDLKLPIQATEQDRRKALAQWLTDPQNPLTARVMVNRIWQGHFGSGLVQTPSDFGRNGLQPSHPELLDWLATEFIRAGWSVKKMHRLIVLSQTYRQSSHPRVDSKSEDQNTEAHLTSLSPMQIDSESRLLWRYPTRRLEAEAIRDSMLFVSGLLSETMYGRGYNLFEQRGGLSGFKPVETFTADNQRRMIYAHKVRREPEAVFGAFDCPDAGQSTALRRASTTPIQALNLFNSPFTLHASEAFASRLKREVGDDIQDQIERAYKIALGRMPTSDELADIVPIVRQHGLSVLCRVLFNSNEFLFIP